MAVIQNSGYSASEFSSMQQDAIQRVREMQRRAQQRLEESNRLAAGMPANRPQMPKPSASAQKTAVSPPAAEPAVPALPFQGILEKLGVDGETGLILILLLLLLNEGADRTLILALVYILVS
ncbi:MAG: hypothetical protein ACOX6P_10790 [Candidatus Merdivicinus sp.]|jgi:hypothetical protein